MADGDITNGSPSDTGWMGDVQRLLAMLIIGVLVSAAAVLVIRLAISAEVEDVIDLTKTMLAALVNMALIALGFFFGSSKAKEQADAGQQKIVDKLTSASPGTLPPTPAGPAPVVPWWSKLTDDEKKVITNNDADPRVHAFTLAATAGAANADDLAYLVSKGLLTQTRADEIAKS